MAFALLSQLEELLYGFKVDEGGAPETASATLQSRLDLEAVKIEAEWNRLYNRNGEHPTPQPPEDIEDYTLTNVVLELLNLETVLADIISIRATSNYSVFYGQARMTRKLAEKRRQIFRTNGIRQALLREIKGDLLPTEAMATGQELARDTPGLTLTEYTIPKLATADRILLRETAWVRALAAKSGRYPQDLGTATNLAKSTYKGLVVGMGAPQIERIRLTPNYTPEIDAQILTALDAGWKGLESFAAQQMRNNF